MESCGAYRSVIVLTELDICDSLIGCDGNQLKLKLGTCLDHGQLTAAYVFDLIKHGGFYLLKF
jgi:hypothetical protein